MQPAACLTIYSERELKIERNKTLVLAVFIRKWYDWNDDMINLTKRGKRRKWTKKYYMYYNIFKKDFIYIFSHVNDTLSMSCDD